MKPETKFKIKALADLRSLPNSWWEKIQQMSINGTPDILGVYRGRFVALELKRSEAAHVDRLQLHKLALISKCGGIALLAHPDNWKAILSFLRGELPHPPAGSLVTGEDSE